MPNSIPTQLFLPLEDPLELPPPVLTKADFVRRYERGEFGNASPTWSNVKEWAAEIDHIHESNRYHLRNRDKGGKTYYDLDPWRLWDWCHGTDWVHEPNWYVSAMAPSHLTTFQGEVQQSERGLDLTYTGIKKPMRDALAEETRHASGYRAWALIAFYMCPTSYDWFLELLRKYPEHVIEFSCFNAEWGTLPHNNTVFWEVRKY
jgi:hypothetical protein